MIELTLEDLQEFGRLLTGAKYRPATEEEIVNFYIIPAGAIVYQDYGSYLDASNKLAEKKIAYRTGCNKNEGIYWTKIGGV